ncbi:MAG: SDR family oxidoreductase [Bryobacterales bacterium]|nr:SDR family oxidoreductase [Bryobacterales bacterium]
MSGILDSKIALVTGGSRGIGLAIAKKLLAEGASVAICGRDAGVLEAAGNELAKTHEAKRVAAIRADVSKLDDVRSLVAQVKERFGGLDVLVNNAGLGVFKSAGDLEPDEWSRMLDTNLSGVYYCCHEAIPLLKQSKSAFILNIGSLAGRNAFAGGAGYNATKFGLLGFTEALMLDHRHDGIRVSCVMPGSVDTEFGHSGTGKEWKIQPEDIADTVLHLLALPERTLVSKVEVRPAQPPK